MLFSFTNSIIRPFLSHAIFLFLLMLLVAMMEGLGIMLLIPLLGTLTGDGPQPGPVQWIWYFFSWVGLPQTVASVLFAFVFLVCFRSLAQLLRDRLSTKFQYEVIDTLRMACFRDLLRVEWRWFIKRRQSDYANTLLTEVNRVGTGLHFGLVLIVSIVTTLTYLVVASILSWKLTLIALLGGGLLFAAIARQRRAALAIGHIIGNANRALQANVQESLASIKLAKIFQCEARHFSSFIDTIDAVRRDQIAFVSSTSLSRFLFQIGGVILLSAFLYFGLTYWKTPISELLTLTLIFGRLVPLFISSQQQYHHCLYALPALKEIQMLLEECREAAEPETQLNRIWYFNHQITLKDIYVRYEGRDVNALEGVELSISARTTTAIIGPSGAGKSTLADVLIGLLKPDYGEIMVDNVQVTDTERASWRRAVAYVPQDVFLFHDSIRNNLLWGNPQASETDLLSALHRAAADFVLDLPQGMNTVVGDNGVRLSGGERQRIALARALLSRPSLLILDEATSSLDIENESHIVDMIEKLHGGLTVVIIGHRLLTLKHADQVIMLEKGKVLMQGTWQDINHLI